MFSTLISAGELRAQLHSPSWVIVDCRFDLADPLAGERAHAQGHLPGAVYAHLDRDLSAPVSPSTGRHPLPSPDALAQTFGRWGIDAGTQVVAYDQGSGAFAARLWWLLRWVGHDAVAVLEGGFSEWSRLGYDISSAATHHAARRFTARPRADFAVTAEEVARRVKDPTTRVLDARAPERYAGVVEPLDTVAGHIPGAHNHPFAGNLDAHQRFLPARELREQFSRTLAGVAPEQTIAMCGSGVTACHLVLGMEHAGLHGAKLYAGSWSEWIRDPHRPVTTGLAP
jgi:thiosulfate/3-mercaptopyruvate sulfurtransferase